MFSTNFIAATKEYSSYPFETHVPAPYMRKTFVLDRLPENATITICGLGFYKLFINGKDITKGHLAPYISNPDDILYYDSYDLTRLLVSGKNVIGIMLGNGMLNCPGGAVWNFDKAPYRSAPKVALALEMTFADGTKDIITADDSFKTHPSAIMFDDLRCGEIYDARHEIVGWNLPDFDDSGWNNAIHAITPHGKPMLCAAEPIVVHKQLKAQKIVPGKLRVHDIPPHKAIEDKEIPIPEEDCYGYLYDFGENLAGNLTLKIKGHAGQRISIQTGERLDENGDVDLRNFSFQPKALNHRIIYTLKGGEEEAYAPSFTYFGFRYCLVSGITEEQATEDLLTYNVMYSDIRKNGDFTCSDGIVNRLQKATFNADISNFYYFPTDCPHREKNGWTGDASLSAEQMMINLTPENSFRVWLENIRAAQLENGALPAYIPSINAPDLGGPTWDSVLFTLPYYAWLYRGDTKIIEENATAMMRYLNYLTTIRDRYGLVRLGYVDWACVDRKTTFTPREVSGTLYAMYDCDLAAKLLAVIGRDEDSGFARRLYNEFRDAARKELLLPDGATLVGRSQTGQALAIAFGMFDNAEKNEAFRVLLDIIHEADDKIDCGVLGGRALFHVLRDFGYTDLAYKMIVGPEYPSYGHWVESESATSLLERFIRPGQRSDSQNHHFWGDVSAWFYKTITGIHINPKERDHREIEIAPYFIDGIDHASAYIEHCGGRVACSWRRAEDGIHLTVEVPEGCYGRLRFPKGYYKKNIPNGHLWCYYPLESGVQEYTLLKNV